MKRNLTIIVALTACIASSVAHARSVYLNGVDISALRNKKFIKAEVTIDANGNVRINAPQYEVEMVKSTAQAVDKAPNDMGGPNPALSKQYYLVTQPSPGGRSQYDFSVFVNGEEKKVIRAGSPQVIMEISKWLRKGDNEIVITAVKSSAAGMKSTSSSDKAKLLVGAGHVENKIVKIDYVKASLEANAFETKTLTEKVVLTAE